MSNFERPEFQALTELEQVADRVAEELNAFRVRAHKAEAAQAQEQDSEPSGGVDRLKADNRELQQRVQYARDRVSDLLARLEFLEEQITSDEAS